MFCKFSFPQESHRALMNTPTNALLNVTGDLSVHQLGAHHTIVTAHRIIRRGQPKYLANKLVLRTPGPRHVITISVSCDLTVSRSGFLYHASKLWNLLPSTIREEQRPEAFKVNVKK